MKEKLPEQLSARKENFSEWYHQLLFIADILDQRYNVKGCFVWKSYGHEIMLRIKTQWDKLFKANGYKELYFPLLVPIEYCEINDSWWKGFRDQAFWVKGGAEGKAKYILRPTGEPAIYPMFNLWIRSYTDLPLKIYETVSSFRYETKHTIPLIRDREITIWHELHTAHETEKEASEELELQMKMWDELWKFCAIYPLKVNKPKWECFPGSIGAVEYYSIMPDGRAIENGSCNNLGQAYAKKFNITFKDKEGDEQFAWMTCTGNGARLLTAVIAAHGDDFGLVLPPNIAPVQIVIVPIYSSRTKEKILEYASKIHAKLKSKFRVLLDDRELTPGSKFYEWDIKGVPLRIEIGKRELESKTITVVRRDKRSRTKLNLKELIDGLRRLLDVIQNGLYERAKKFVRASIVDVKDQSEILKTLSSKKIPRIYWCGSGVCWDKIKMLQPGIELFGTDLQEFKEGKCAICGKPTKTKGYIANTY